jgi:UDP-N-acetylglucosamine 2-epimerase (non-hydrolysing)
MKTVITVSGIRPDFIRMSSIFKKLDDSFNHILVHTGQHFDNLLSDVFFDELEIRKPDYNLSIGGSNKEHFHQTSELQIKLIELIRNENLNPDVIVFLGDSNSVLASTVLKKEGYKIAHIEAGMRSYDKRMLEEINRTICDHCSDYLFVYHDNYKEKALKENIPAESIFVVGNTIVEVIKNVQFEKEEKKNKIVLDIHRPENFKYKNRLKNILSYANLVAEKYNCEVEMLGFGRTLKEIQNNDLELGNIKNIDLLSFKNYLKKINSCKFIISDSGTAQEEPCLLGIPVIVPRDFTERPESVENNCSFMIDVNTENNQTWSNSFNWIDSEKEVNTDWLGDGTTSDKIIETLKKLL